MAWITGAGGLIGNYLVQTAPQFARNWRVVGLTRSQLDLLDQVAVRRVFQEQRPELVIHCAAMSRSPDCQAQPELARRINVEATALLAELAARIPFVFFSSDLVFDGRKGNYVETDPVGPLSIYAETKVAAERVVLANPRHTVIRTALSGGTSPTGDRGFNEQMRLAWQAGRTLKFFDDEFRPPIPAVVTARGVWELVAKGCTGVFHVAGAERLSRLRIGQLIAARWPQLQPRFEAASAKHFSGPPRPGDSTLNCPKAQKVLSFPLPGFRRLAGRTSRRTVLNPQSAIHNAQYRGRLAPSPTGYLHLGHARTFWTAQERARTNGGTLVLRNEDLDGARCKPEFVTAMFEDLKWFGFDWQEGPDCGGPFGPYNQSERTKFYRAALDQLRAAGFIYPCTCSCKDIRSAARAPHIEDDNEPIYPGTCREHRKSQILNRKFSWRFRVPDGETICFVDGNFGPQQFVAGKGFGDFVVWRHDDVPAYQLAVVVDDAAMRISEVVRGEDLLKSTARQLLLYRALGLTPPKFFHCPLMTDDSGVRLAKRHDALSLRKLREHSESPETIRRAWQFVSSQEIK